MRGGVSLREWFFLKQSGGGGPLFILAADLMLVEDTERADVIHEKSRRWRVWRGKGSTQYLWEEGIERIN